MKISSFISTSTQVVLVGLLYLLLSVAVFWPRWQLVTTHYGAADFDTDGTLWYFWASSFAKAQQIHFNYTNNLIAYPFGYDVSFIPFYSLIYEVQLRLIDLLGGSWSSIITVSNASTLLSYPLAAWTAFLLAYYLTRRTYPSLVAGLVFSFSYYHVQMVKGSLSLNHIQFIPLVYLSLLMYIRQPTFRRLVLAALLAAVTFLANAYWGFFSVFFTPFFFFLATGRWQRRLRLFLQYGGGVLLLTVLLKPDYFASQLYNLSPYHLQYVIPKPSSPDRELLSALAYFTPSSTALLRPWFSLKGEHFLGFAVLVLAFLALKIKKNAEVTLFFGLFLLVALLSVQLAAFTWLTDLYFTFFRTFRAVSRLVIFGSLFLGILVAFSLREWLPRFRHWLYQSYGHRAAQVVMVGVLGLLPVLILIEGLSLSLQNWHRTNMQNIASLYTPLADDPSVRRIVAYPLAISGQEDGFPPNYELLGQIVHQKTLVGGLSRFHPPAAAFRAAIADLDDPAAIAQLAAYDIDTVLVYMNMTPDAEQLFGRLLLDSRLLYRGLLTAPIDDPAYLSGNDQSRRVAVFQVRSVLARQQAAPAPEVTVSQAQVAVQQQTATTYRLRFSQLRGPFQLFLDEPYSLNWRLHLPTDDWQAQWGLRAPVRVGVQTPFQQATNQWQLDLNQLRSLPDSPLQPQADGSYQLELVLSYQPSFWVKVSHWTAPLTLAVLGGGILGEAWWQRRRQHLR